MTSNDCWMKSQCKKYNDPTAPCRSQNFCMRRYKIEELFKQAALTPKQYPDIALHPDNNGTDLDKFKQLQEIRKNIVSFVRGGKNLYIYSSITGNGKTEWSIKLLKEYIYKIWPESDLTARALFVNIPRFFIALKNSFSNTDEYAKHIQDNILNADLVVWDEIGCKSLTDFEHEHLLNMINMRLDMGKSNIYTSNLNAGALKSAIGARLYSRVIELSESIEFRGQDKRSCGRR